MAVCGVAKVAGQLALRAFASQQVSASLRRECAIQVDGNKMRGLMKESAHCYLVDLAEAACRGVDRGSDDVAGDYQFHSTILLAAC